MTGTNADGLLPKYAATSCPLAYPAPIIVPTLTITAANVCFMISLYCKATAHRSPGTANGTENAAPFSEPRFMRHSPLPHAKHCGAKNIKASVIPSAEYVIR